MKKGRWNRKLGIYIDDEIYDFLVEESDKVGVTITHLVRKAIRKYMENNK